MSIRCISCEDKSCAVAVLNDAELEFLGGNIAEVNFQKGEKLFHEGALTSHIYYLRKGLVKIHKKVDDQRDHILKIAVPPAYLGLPTVFGHRINQYSATALNASTVCMIDITAFTDLIHSNGKFAYEIIADICKDELEYYQRFVDQAHRQAPGLIAGALLYFCENVYKGSCFEIGLTRSEIAQLLGISRESVTRNLYQFKEDGIIDMEKNLIRILDKEMLRTIKASG